MSSIERSKIDSDEESEFKKFKQEIEDIKK